MKILYTSSTIDPTIEKRHFLQLGLNLKALGNDLLFLVPRYGRAENKNHGINIVFIPAGKPSPISYIWTEFLRFLYFPFLLLKFRPDVIYNRKALFDFGPPFWTWLLRISYVVEVNGIIEEELRINKHSEWYFEWFIKIVKLIEAINYKAASRVICVTDGIKRWLLKHYRIKENRLVVMSNGADIDLFQPINKKECQQKLGLDENFFYIGFIGSFAPWQGLKTLIMAAKRVKESGYPIRYFLVGSGAQEAALRQLVNEMGLKKNVYFAGWVGYETIPLYINSFNVCYVSKGGLSSGFSPLKLYEYLACARPVIASRVEGITEVVEEGKCGFLFKPDNVEELAEVIVECFKQRSNLEQLGFSGRKLVERKYSWRSIAQKTMTLLNEIKL